MAAFFLLHQVYWIRTGQPKSQKSRQEFQVPKMEGFYCTLFSAVLGGGMSRIHKPALHTAYIGIRIPPFGWYRTKFFVIKMPLSQGWDLICPDTKWQVGDCPNPRWVNVLSKKRSPTSTKVKQLFVLFRNLLFLLTTFTVKSQSDTCCISI